MELSSTLTPQLVGLIILGFVLLAYPAFVLRSLRKSPEKGATPRVRPISIESVLVPLALALFASSFVLRSVVLNLTTLVGMGHHSAAIGAAEAQLYLLLGFASAFAMAAMLPRLGAVASTGTSALSGLLLFTGAVLVGQLAMTYWLTRETSVYTTSVVSIANGSVAFAAVLFALFAFFGLRAGSEINAKATISLSFRVSLAVALFVGGILTWFIRRRLLEIGVVWW